MIPDIEISFNNSSEANKSAPRLRQRYQVGACLAIYVGYDPARQAMLFEELFIGEIFSIMDRDIRHVKEIESLEGALLVSNLGTMTEQILLEFDG